MVMGGNIKIQSCNKIGVVMATIEFTQVKITGRD